jgi:hypothetical protein
MLKFQWNALRRGDRVFVHDPGDANLRLRAGIVTLVDTGRRGHDVGIRLTTGTHTSRVVRPGRFAVHLDNEYDDDCWRCTDNQPETHDSSARPPFLAATDWSLAPGC